MNVHCCKRCPSSGISVKQHPVDVFKSHSWTNVAIMHQLQRGDRTIQHAYSCRQTPKHSEPRTTTRSLKSKSVTHIAGTDRAPFVTTTGSPTAARAKSTRTRAKRPAVEAVAAQKSVETSLEQYPPSAAGARQEEHKAPQQQGLFSGPCLVAAGALACSFISLQVKLFDTHVPPLQVTACSSAVAWLATAVILGRQGHRELHTPVPAAPVSEALREEAPTAAAAASTPSTQSLLLLRGLLGAATVTAYYAAVEELPLPVAVALFFFHPVLALLLNAAVTKTRVSPRAAASCALTVLGVLVIGWHDQLMLHLEQAVAFVEVLGSEGFDRAAAAAAAAGSDVIMGPELSLYGVLMGLIAASANAAAFVVVGLIGREVPTLNVCWWQYCVTTHAAVAVLLLSQLENAVVQGTVPLPAGLEALLPGLVTQQQQQDLQVLADATTAAAAATGSIGSDVAQVSQQLLEQLQHALPSQHDGLLLGGVVVANFAGQLLLNAGFQRIDAGRGAAINTLQVLFANLWDVVLLHSSPSAAMMAGSGMIAAGVVGTRQSATTADPPEPGGMQPAAAAATGGEQQHTG